MKILKTARYKKKAGTWDVPLLIDKMVEICTAQWMWDAKQAAWWLEKKYKNPIDPAIRADVIQKAQEQIDKIKKKKEIEKNEGSYIL